MNPLLPIPLAVALVSALVAAVTDVLRFRMHNLLTLPLLAMFARIGSAGPAWPFPAVADLPAHTELPDPLVLLNGKRVTTKTQWLKERRPEYLHGRSARAAEKHHAEKYIVFLSYLPMIAFTHGGPVITEHPWKRCLSFHRY